MTFTSISDLYFVATGLLGLNILVDVLIDTGLIYLPFIMVIIESLYKGFQSSKAMSDTSFALKSMETRCYGMLIVMILAFIPVMPFSIESTASYERMCDISGEESTVVISGRDLQTSGSLIAVSGYDLRVPPLLNYLMNLANGVTVESVNRLPCSINIVGMQKLLYMQKIDDADLKLEIKEFMYQCYQPARSLALQNMDRNIPWIADPNVSGGDASWPGHEALRTAEYYGNVSRGMYSKTAMQGWQSSPNNAQYYKYAELDAAQQASAGYPTCLEWWDGVGSGFGGVFTPNDISKGLRARLMDEFGDYASPSLWQRIRDDGNILNNAQNADDAMRIAFFNTYDIDEIKGMEVKDYADETEGGFSTVMNWALRAGGTVANAKQALQNFGVSSMMQVALPIAKSVLLFVLLVPFPLALIVSKYSMSFVVQYCFFMFAVMFCPFLWDMSILVQQSYIQEVVGGDNSFMVSSGATTSDSWFGAAEVVTKPNALLFATYMLDAMFIAFPAILIGLFTAAGMQIGQTMGSAINGLGDKGGVGSAASSAGKTGGNTVQSKANKVGNKVSQGVKAKAGRP